MIWVSFFKPTGIFEGSFNKFAAWWTAGDYCHCEIVWHIEPIDLMDCVKTVYNNLNKGEKNDKNSKICAELESVFFTNRHNIQLLQEEKPVYISFSLLWGDQLRVRFLENIEDPWVSTPEKPFDDITWVKCDNILKEKKITCLQWALSELTKPYNQGAALLSWVPHWGVNDTTSKSAYFCSEFASICLVKMKYLKPMNTLHCTPNHLEAKLRLIGREENEETEEDNYEASSDDELTQLEEKLNTTVSNTPIQLK